MSARAPAKFLQPEQIVLTDIGPCLHAEGVTYRVWALGHQSVSAHVEKADGKKYEIVLQAAKDSGYFWGVDPHGKAGDLYKYSLDNGTPLPDFVSHFQPQGAFGPSMVIDANAYQWQATSWVRPKWKGQTLYECHIGTLTPEGTYQAAVAKLDHLVDLGITALEIMPVCDWSGNRNWGYDGTYLFAPANAYGTPDDFRALIDACHLRGIAVILDLVYNHLGPEGNFSHDYSHVYFHEGKDNPWGQNFNLDGPDCEPVRSMLRQNVRYWLGEFRIDGFRMDATHMVHDPSPVHLLAEVSSLVHQHGGFIIAEDDRNARSILEPREQGGWGFDALWSDDFHHTIRVGLTGERQYFLSMFEGSHPELVKILQRGWLYSGEYSSFHKEPRGTPAGDFPPQSFVFCISNHDQVGNRIQGVRLHQSIEPAAYRAISLFLCLCPYTPLIFQGQEWGCTAPFHYFTQMSDELGQKITDGRRREFLHTGFATCEADLDGLLSPQDEKAFTESKLDWSEIGQEEHARLLSLYRSGFKLRRELFPDGNPPRSEWKVMEIEGGLRIDYHLSDRTVSVLLLLKPAANALSAESTVLLRSNDARFSGSNHNSNPELVVLSRPAAKK